MKSSLFAAAALLATATAVPAFADTLTTGTGDGKVTVDVNGFGEMGSGNGFYDPVGSTPGATTIFGSTIFYRLGTDSGNRITLNENSRLISFSGTDTARTSSFTLADDAIGVTLNQSVSALYDTSGNATGSLLTQSYNFTNLGAAAVTLDLVRYLDGDLAFDGSNIDGGGAQLSNGNRVLFETDNTTNAATSATFVGIYNEGAGVASGYDLRNYNAAASYLRNGGALTNSVERDTTGDGFVDSGYDVTLNLGRQLTLGAGGGGTVTTRTLFGTGLPREVSVPGAVPEPATWAMFVMGFGVIGGALRRRGTGGFAAA